MSSNASLIARLGLDAAGFNSGLKQAEATARQSHGAMAGAASRSTTAHNDLFKSATRVQDQIGNLVRTVGSGADSFEVATTAAEGLANSLRLSLGAAAGIGVGIMSIRGVQEIREEYQNLREAIDKLNAVRPAGADQSLEQIRKHAEAAGKTIDELEKRISNRSGGGGILGRLWQNAKDLATHGAPGASFVDALDKSDLQKTQSGREEDLLSEVAKLKEANDRKALARSESSAMTKARQLESERGPALAEAAATTGQRGFMEVARKFDLELQAIVDDLAAARQNRFKMGLGDLAAIPLDGRAASAGQVGAGIQAREVQRIEAEGMEKAHKYGDFAGAQDSMTRASALRDQIPTLKDGEKDSKQEMTGAIDASNILKQMLEKMGTGDVPRNR